jgi:hypothetical protein
LPELFAMMGNNDKPQDELFYTFNLDEIVQLMGSPETCDGATLGAT